MPNTSIATPAPKTTARLMRTSPSVRPATLDNLRRHRTVVGIAGAGLSALLAPSQPGHDGVVEGRSEMTTRRIVVGVDGSDHSLRAVKWCAEYAQLLDAEVIAVHAIDMPVYL